MGPARLIRAVNRRASGTVHCARGGDAIVKTYIGASGVKANKGVKGIARLSSGRFGEAESEYRKNQCRNQFSVRHDNSLLSSSRACIGVEAGAS